MDTVTAKHPVVSDARWIEERQKLLAREKELTHLRDEIASARRALPWRRVTADYEPAPRAALASACCHAER